jgi:hypothetical protein
MKKISLILNCLLLLSFITLGQNTIWSEDFTGQDGKGQIGTTQDLSGVEWTIDVSGGTFSDPDDFFAVNSGVFEGQDVDGTVYWQSNLLNISNYSSLQISIDVFASGDFEASGDIFDIELYIDDIAQTIFTGIVEEEVPGDPFFFGETQLTSSLQTFTKNISGTGTEAYVKISINNNAGTETVGWDNLVLQGISAGTNTLVAFSSSSATVSEGDGTYILNLSITNEDATNATQCEVALISGSADDINSYSTQTVTFPAGSNSDQTVTLTISDDAVYEGDETLTFEIQNISGGNLASAGIPSAFNLTIEDNDTPTTPNLIITEVMQNPDAVNDSYGEWLEIYNAGDSPVDINGFIIKDNGSDNHTINNGGSLIISSGEYLIMGINADAISNGGVHIDYQYSGITLSNSDDEIILYLSDGTTEIDRVEYDGGTIWPAPTGTSMSLDMNHLSENNNGAYWHEAISTFGDGDFGTPGAPNDYPLTTWTGTVNNYWTETGNWDNGTPSSTVSAHIPSSGITIFPSAEASDNAQVLNLIVESDATLLGAEHITINGKTTVKRSLSVGKWQYLTPPVSGATANDIEITTSGQYAYIVKYNNDAAGSGSDLQSGWEYISSDATGLTPGRGYGVQVTESKEINFSGTLATGNQTIAGLAVGDGGNNPWVLVGNSALAHIDWTLVTDDDDITSSAYFYDPVLSGYATITQAGGTTNTSSTLIPPMQGFFVEVDASGDGSLTLPASTLTHGGQAFYKSKYIQNNIVRLAINNDEYYDETLIYFNDNASNKYEPAYDAHKLLATTPGVPQLYTGTGEHQLAINVLNEMPVSVPLFVYSTKQATLTLKVVELENLNNEINITIEDRLTNTSYDLMETNEIEIITNEGDNANRFVLHFSNSITNVRELSDIIKVYPADNDLVIEKQDGSPAILNIYSLMGQSTYSTVLQSQKSTIQHGLPDGFYIVKVIGGQTQHIQKVFLFN